MKAYLFALATFLIVAVGCVPIELQQPAASAPPERAADVPELFASIPADASQVAAVHDATVDQGQKTREAVNQLGQQLQQKLEVGLETVRSAIATIQLPPAPVPRSGPATDPPPVEPTPSLVFFGFEGCVHCPRVKKWIPIARANGEIVKEVDVSKDATVPYQLAAEVNKFPSIVRLDQTGKEIDRVPAFDAEGFNDSELRRVLKLPEPAPPPRSTPRPMPFYNGQARSVPMPSPPVSRRAARRGF